LICLKKYWLYGYRISVFPVVNESHENRPCHQKYNAIAVLLQAATVASFQHPPWALGLLIQPQHPLKP
jgi:hypothetical protein